MAILPIYNFFILDGEILNTSRLIKGEYNGEIYEVLRIMNGVPLFLEDHMERFYRSAKLAGKTIQYTITDISTFLAELIEKNQATEGNVLISYNIHLKAFFIRHKYPTPEMYGQGVTCGILKAERKNPNAKIFQSPVRQQADKMIAENGFYEVILVDHDGFVTEGSRSNVCFVKNGQLFTSPGNQVLLGITRQKTLEIAKKLHIEWVEEPIQLTHIGSFDGAFVTGTSPKILPICQIEETHFDPHNMTVRKLMKRYDEMILEYIEKNK
jgi:branched-chain amino acid aminotransferase